MEFLNKVCLGNTIQDWFIAFCIFVVLSAFLKSVQRIMTRRLSRLAVSTDNKIDDLLVRMIKNTKFFILLVASAYVASCVITLKPAINALWQKTIILALILQGGFWASAAVSFWLGRKIEKNIEQDASSATTITFLGFVARIILWVIVLLLILDNIGVNITGLIAGLGIGGIAIALAVQNILGNLLASLSIVLDKPFVIGDFIVVDSLAGTIEHIGLRTTRIRSLTGEQLVFSNDDLLKSRIHNYQHMSERRVVFSFGVVYQTSLEKLKAIKEIITDIIRKQENARFDRVHFKEYGDSSLNFEVVYFVTNRDYNMYMDVQESINQEIFRRFEEGGIEFAYPTQTIFIQRDAS